MSIRIPDPPIPIEEQKLSYQQIATRWGIPSSYVKLTLQRGGVPVVPVERSPVPGVKLVDLLEFEKRLRTEQKKEADKRMEVVR
jgi:hypothetical protein